jgi:nucleotide-binding universal stress UspA family protein
MRILCGTDFSPVARRAAAVAGLLARQQGGTVELVHSVGPVTRGWDNTLAMELLAHEVESLRLQGTSVDRHGVVVGDPSPVLVEQAAHLSADLLVIGAVGHRMAERFLVGSVAARTARESPIPVLVIRGSAPFEAWLHGKRPLRVTVGYERGPSSDAALRWVGTLAGLGPIDLNVVHLVLPASLERPGEEKDPWAPLEVRPSEAQKLADEIRQQVSAALGNLAARPVVKGTLGRRDVPLVLEAEAAEADLLVVGSHQRKGFQRWWHGSVAAGVLHSAPMNVAVVPHRPA